jgi:hypothetical protein
MALTGRSRNVVLAWQNFVDESITVLTSPTSFVSGMPLSNVKNDRLKKVARTTGNSVIFDFDFGQAVPISMAAILGHNLTENATMRIQAANARSGTASAPGGYTLALPDLVYDTRQTLRSGTARGAYTWTSSMLDHDFTTGTLPAGSSFSRASPATYFDYTGTMRTAATGEPRYDYDPVTKTARGILIEEARTNLLLNSEALSTQSVVVTAQAYTLSFYGTGTITLSGASTAGPLVGGGAFPARTTLTFTPAAGTLMLTVTGTVQYAQLEAGAFPTSYIPTTATTVTRATDFLNMPTSVLPFNSAAGTLLTSFKMPYVGGAGYPGAAFFDDGTVNNYIGSFVADAASDATYFEVKTGGVQQFYGSVGTYVAGTSVTVGGAWSAANFAASLNGSTPATSSSGTIPTVNVLRVGTLLANLAPLNGWISRLTYIASRVSNADLQTLTNPATSAATRAATLAPYAGTAGTAAITLGTGSKTVYVDDADMRFYAGTTVRLSIDDSNYMSGTVTSYYRPSRRLVINSTTVVGSGSATTMAVTRETDDIKVWPDVTPFGEGGYWGRFTWGGLLSLVGRDYLPPGIHMPALFTGDDEPIYARYLKLEITDTSLSYIDIGRLFLSAAYQPTRNLEFDWSLTQVDPSPKERSRGGQVYVDGRPQYRRIALRLSGISRDEIMSQVYEMQRELGVRRPFLLIVDPTDPINLHRLTLYGSRPDDAPISNPLTNNYYAVEIVSEEWL